MFKHLLLPLSLIISVGFSGFALAQGERYEANVHYDVITPAIRTADQSKIEVSEFFWYGCGHCYTFEPMITQWKKSIEDDVNFLGSPAVWNKPMELHAKAYFTAQTLGVLDTMHLVLFQAMNVDRKRLSSEEEIAALFAANGVAAEDFNKAFGSFGIDSQLRQANSRARAAKVTGTPELLVNGKYRVSTSKAGSQAELRKVVDFLIAKERAAKAS